jgi:LysM repeat protein
MQVRTRTLAGALALALTLVVPAGAALAHTVRPGETLWSLAATQGLTATELAAHNGIDEAAPLVDGTEIDIPVAAAPTAAGETTVATASSTGSHTVQPGDTLSAIALAAGLTTDELAAHNGLASDGIVVEGSVLELPAASGATSAVEPPPEAITATTGVVPTSASIGSAEIAQIAAEHGVPGDLAAAIAWQESGFSNGVVSPAGATGVMQVLPSTWGWIQSDLASETLDPASASDNVRAGVIFLGQLLADSGGDEVTAVASYYQGASSVAANGLFPETQQYVDNVMALRSEFGG